MGERELIGVIGIIALFGLIGLRMPIGLAMLVVGIVGNYFLSLVTSFLRFGPYLKQFKSILWENVASYDLSVVPLFILMGVLAGRAGLSADLFRGFEAMTSRIRGGVAMAAIAACGGFGAVSGSSVATAATMGRVALPELERVGYHPRLATGALAAGGTLGILIPPSVALVLYAVVVEGSILDMFQAAILPGLLAVLGFMLMIAIWGRLVAGLCPEPSGLERQQRNHALKRLMPVLAIFGSIILGLGFGLFTPTPAASIGVAMILIYGMIVPNLEGKRLRIADLRDSLLEAAAISGMIYFILFGAEVLKTFFSRSGLPAAMSDWAMQSAMSPMLVLVIMLIVFVILGCFLESLSMILVVVPFFWPILDALNGGMMASANSAAFGMSADDLKIWFGILTVVVVEVGMITPPVGMNVFVISSLAHNVPMSETFRGVIPFVLIEVVRVSLILLLPGIVLLLPHLL